MNAITLIIIYLVSVNCISFIIMGVDKHKARKRAWRIPESTLFVLALIVFQVQNTGYSVTITPPSLAYILLMPAVSRMTTFL